VNFRITSPTQYMIGLDRPQTVSSPIRGHHNREFRPTSRRKTGWSMTASRRPRHVRQGGSSGRQHPRLHHFWERLCRTCRPSCRNCSMGIPRDTMEGTGKHIIDCEDPNGSQAARFTQRRYLGSYRINAYGWLLSPPKGSCNLSAIELSSTCL
jgi:hypothetical protein